MSVGRICLREVDLAERDETVQVAARRMHDRKVGTLVVIEPGGEPLGIITDRDLAVRVVAEGKSPAEVLVSDVMTWHPETVREDTSIESALAMMRRGAFRRMLVVNDQGKLAGLVSLDDILELLSEEFRDIGALVEREGPSSLAHG